MMTEEELDMQVVLLDGLSKSLESKDFTIKRWGVEQILKIYDKYKGRFNNVR